MRVLLSESKIQERVREMARQFFEIRLWTGDDLIQQVLDHYEALPADLRAELPLKRIWTLAVSEG